MMSNESKSLVLIVDDNPQNLQVLGNLLKNNGYTPVLARKGTEALDFVQKKPPDLILLDIMMSEMDGIETCRRLQEQETTKNIPVIFITALTDTSEKLRAFEAGGVDYITKPFVKVEVLARIRVHITLKKALEKLANLSITDELTGVFNRRFAYQILTKLMEFAKREKHSLSLCFLDIDRLKQINDTYGHAEGDRLITTVVNALKRITRSSDYLCRMGGDEFLLIFPKIALETPDALIERIREQLNRQTIQGIPIDFSFGFSEFHSDGNISADELIKIADARMYDAKMKKKAGNTNSTLST